MFTGAAAWFHLTDHQFSSVVVLDDTATVIERVVYDPYGLARHHYGEDVTGDGGVDSTRDVSFINGVAGGGNNDIGEANNRAEMDLDRDGDVDYKDASIVSTCD